MQTNDNSKKIMVTLSVAVVIIFISVIAYFISINASKIWPKGSTKETSKVETNESKIVFEKPIVDEKNDMLHLNAQIQTNEQGDCTLTLSNSENTYTLTNSTKGIEGKTGCLDWNIGTNSIKPGFYKAEIKFVGKTQVLSSEEVLTIK